MNVLNMKDNPIIGLHPDVPNESVMPHSPIKNKKTVIAKKIKKSHNAGEKDIKHSSFEDEYLTIPFSSSTNPDFLFKNHARPFIFNDFLYSHQGLNIIKMLIDAKTWIVPQILYGVLLFTYWKPASGSTATGGVHDNDNLETLMLFASKQTADHSFAMNDNKIWPEVDSSPLLMEDVTWATNKPQAPSRDRDEHEFFFEQNFKEQNSSQKGEEAWQWWKWNDVKNIRLTNDRFSPEELKESLNKTLNFFQSIQWSNDRFSPEEIQESLQAWLQHLEELSSYWLASA